MSPSVLELSFSPFLSQNPLTEFQSQVDRLVSGFVEQATDWRSLAAMTAGEMAYRLGRIGVLSAGVQNFACIRMGEPLRRMMSIGTGLVAEVSAFEMTNRALMTVGENGRSSLYQNLWRWDGPGGIRQGLLSSLVTFGSLKSLGRLVQGENIFVQHLFQDSGMVLGHQLSGILGVTPRPEGTIVEQFLRAEVVNLQMGVGMVLVSGFSPGMKALEKGWDLLIPSPLSPSLDLTRYFEPAMAANDRGLTLPMMSKRWDEGETDRRWNDSNRLKRRARKNDPQAYEMLKGIVEEGQWEALNILAELAEKRLEAVFALIELAEAGHVGAWTRLKNLNPEGLMARLGWRDPTQGRRGEAFLYLAGIGNGKALKILVQDATWHLERGSLTLLQSLAEHGHTASVMGIGEAARRNPKAVQALCDLAEKGDPHAPGLLANLDPAHYESLLPMHGVEMISPLSTLSHFGNVEAFRAISQAAHRYESAVKSLAALALKGRPHAVQAIAKAMKSINPGPADEASKVLRELADQGNQAARKALPSLALVKMVERPLTIFGRVWRLYVKYFGRPWL